jgi:hypothetical protein
MDCLSHKNAAVRRAADSILEFVLEQDRKDDGELGKLGNQIKKKRFEGYNSAWLQELANLDSESMGYDQSGYGRSGSSRFPHSDDLDVDPSINWRSQIGMQGQLGGSRLNYDEDDDDDDDDLDHYNGRYRYRIIVLYNSSYLLLILKCHLRSSTSRWEQAEMISKYRADEADYYHGRNYKEDD